MKDHAQIIARVAAEHGLKPKHLTGLMRTRRVSWARQEAMHAIAEETHASNAEIGTLLGGRTSWTVRAGIAAHRARMAREVSE